MRTQHFSTWNWLDDLVLPLLLSIVRTCWIWPWLGLVQLALAPQEPRSALSIALVLLLPFSGFLLARYAAIYSINLDQSEVDKGEISWPVRLSVASAGLFAAVGVTWWQLYRPDFGVFNPTWLSLMGDSLIHWTSTGIPPAVIVSLTVLLLWFRGLLDAGQTATHDRVWNIFLMGVIMLVLYLLVISLGQLNLVNRLVTAVIVMLAAGMAALAFSTIKITAGLDRALGFGERNLGIESGVIRSEATPVLNRYWFISVGSVIALLMGTAILLTLAIAPEALSGILNLIWNVFRFIGDIIIEILLILTYFVALIFFYLYQFIEPLLRRLFDRLNIDSELFQQAEQEQPATESIPVESAPVPDEYRWIGVAVFAVITLLAFALVLRRLRNTETELFDEVRESILSTSLLQEQFSSLWDRLTSRFRRSARDPFLALDGDEHSRRIRASYRQLLLAADKLGKPRQPALTPREYHHTLTATDTGAIESSAPELTEGDLSRLTELFGTQFSRQLDRITTGYVLARYGDVAPTREMANDVTRAWDEIQASLDEAGMREDGTRDGDRLSD